jgi:hypothetical protein
MTEAIVLIAGKNIFESTEGHPACVRPRPTCVLSIAASLGIDERACSNVISRIQDFAIKRLK